MYIKKIKKICRTSTTTRPCCLLYNYNNNSKKLVFLNYKKISGLIFNDKHKKIEKNIVLEKSKSRSRRKIFELAYCNNFQYFVTITLNPKIVNRTNIDEVYDHIKSVFHSFKTMHQDFKYLFIFEYHKDKRGIHLHGLADIPIGELSMNKYGYYECDYFNSHFGFTSISLVRNYVACSKYITKYITKDIVKLPNHYRYICSRGLNRPIVTEITGLDFNSIDFDYENDYVKIKDNITF